MQHGDNNVDFREVAVLGHVVAMKDGTVWDAGVPREVITPALIEELYGLTVRVVDVDGEPAIVPVG